MQVLPSGWVVYDDGDLDGYEPSPLTREAAVRDPVPAPAPMPPRPPLPPQPPLPRPTADGA
jgi:hypothetical protein